MTDSAHAQFDALPVGVGDIVGKYRITQLLAQGGMGAVFRAQHEVLEKAAAIKVMLPELASEPEAARRFSVEAHTAATLSSDFIASVTDVDTLPCGTPYMVMEYVDGQSLADLIDEGPLDARRAAAIGMQIAAGLAIAHSADVVHRDLKPANVMITTTETGGDRAKILDFGIAKATKLNGNDVSVTNSRALLGSPRYMSPEQVSNSARVDSRTDIWALGVLLWEMLTGEILFDGQTIGEVLLQIGLETPSPPSARNPSVPPELDDVVLGCLQRQRQDRYADAKDVMAALAPFAPPRIRHALLRASVRPPPSRSGLIRRTTEAPTVRADVEQTRSVEATANTLNRAVAPPPADTRWRFAVAAAIIAAALFGVGRYSDGDPHRLAPQRLLTANNVGSTLKARPAAAPLAPVTPAASSARATPDSKSPTPAPRPRVPRPRPPPPKKVAPPPRAIDPLVAQPGTLDSRD